MAGADPAPVLGAGVPRPTEQVIVVIRRMIRRMARMQMHLSEELYRRVEDLHLPVSEILQDTLHRELCRREKLAALDEYLAELCAEVGEPTAHDRVDVEHLMAQIHGDDVEKAG